jgi:hypothetical protein
VTQSSSKARLKKDTIGEEGLKKLYKAYSDLTPPLFKHYCIALVQSGGGNQDTKNVIISSIEKSNSKDFILTKTNNFVFAGLGLGV